MTAVELLENMGANASKNTVEASQQFWTAFETERERFENRKLWCVVHPDKDDDQSPLKDDDDNETSLFVN
ncbi:hypothetical protein [Alteromonas sp. ASW11-130]|uniref:hypothetical protein n=1 Tax=Alteromonas sp. ASW11-130 TaxID=3015775 RepID=UPI00224299A2|nr:hypothetical protein [Alteromonas sp. ASW11-130]MCW8091465.1 hypothetical protein [Alteromonas sp. ASW11-130]